MEVRDFKTAAKVVADYLSRDGVEVSQSRMLEALSRGFGGRNWVSFRESLAALSLPASTKDPLGELTAMVRQLLDAMIAQEKRDSGLLKPYPAGIALDWQAAVDEGQRWLKLIDEGITVTEPKWLAQVNAIESETDMRAISVTIESLAAHLNAGPETVDFGRVSRHSPNIQHLVAVLRTSFSYRHRVRGWFDLRDFATDYLTAHGLDCARVLKGLDKGGLPTDSTPSSNSRPMFIPGIRTEAELAKAMPILKHLLRQMMFPLTPVDRTPPWEFAMLEEALKWVWHHHSDAAELKHVQEYLERHPDKRAHDMAFQLSPWVTKERLRWFDGVPESYVVEHGLDGITGEASSGVFAVVRDTGRGPARTVLVSGTLSAKLNGAQVEAQATLNLTTGEVCTVWSPGITPFPFEGCVDERFIFETEVGGKFPLPLVSDGTGNKCVEKKGLEFVRYLMREQGPWQGH